MKTMCLLSVLVAGLLAATAYSADPPPKSQMYEDIEIMRRLIEDKVWTQYQTVTCATCHKVAKISDLRSSSEPLTLSAVREVNYWPSMPHDQAHAFLTTNCEGVYLKGQGVVFTITLPPSERDPTTMGSGAETKTTSDWDRMRKKVRQEKPSDDDKTPPRKDQSLAEILLHVLAENGSHLGQLGDNESIAVVVTFRAAQVRPGVGGPLIGSQPHFELPQYYPPGYDQKTQKPRTQAEELLLLGDLHRKQGKIEDALNTYRTAIDQTASDAKVASLVLIKIAEILKEQGKDKEAQDMLQRAVDLLKTAETKGSGSGEVSLASLPSKLIVSAPKKLLDQSGAGKISFDDFAKAASVELIKFGAEQKSSGSGSK